MTTSNMNFGPEWMRKLSRPNSSQNLSGLEGEAAQENSNSNNTYSSIISVSKGGEDLEDTSVEASLNPFRYSRGFMLSLYKAAPVPSDFEKHEYVTLEEPLPPVDHSPLTELEQKLLASGQINSVSNRRNQQNANQTQTTRTNREGQANRGRGGRANSYSSRPSNNQAGGIWGNVSKSSIGTFGNDGVFHIDGVGDSIDPVDFALAAERFEQERRARRNQNLSSKILDNEDDGQNRGGRSSLKNILVGLPGTEEQEVEINPEDVSNWYYKDPTGIIQGPFSGYEMHEWYLAGYFQGDLLLRREEESSFEPLAHLIARIGDEEKPFLTPPRASHLRTILTPRASRFSFNEYEGQAEPTSPFTKGSNQTYTSYTNSEASMVPNDLHYPSYSHSSNIYPVQGRNPYHEAAFFHAQQQQREFYMRQQMAFQGYHSNPLISPGHEHMMGYPSMNMPYSQHSFGSLQPQHQPQAQAQGQAQTQTQSQSQSQSQVVQINESVLPSESEVEKITSDLNQLKVDETSPKQAQADTNSSHSTKLNQQAIKSKSEAKKAGKEVKQEAKPQPETKVSPPTQPKPAPWQGASKPTKSLREIQKEEEAKAKARNEMKAKEQPKRYADTLTKSNPHNSFK